MGVRHVCAYLESMGRNVKEELAPFVEIPLGYVAEKQNHFEKIDLSVGDIHTGVSTCLQSKFLLV